VPTLALHGINGDSAGTSWMRNPPEERDSTGNHQLFLCRFRPVRSKCAENTSNSNNSRISSSKIYVVYPDNANFKKKIEYENLLRLKINLIRPY
jgi:hypothetical protein